jgi:hypothetical protein
MAESALPYTKNGLLDGKRRESLAQRRQDAKEEKKSFTQRRKER